MGVDGGSCSGGGSGSAGVLGSEGGFGSEGVFGSEGDFGVDGVSCPDGGLRYGGGSGHDGGADPGGEPGQSVQNGCPTQGSGREAMSGPSQILSPPCSAKRAKFACSAESVPGSLPCSNKILRSKKRIQPCCFDERLSKNSAFWAILRVRATSCALIIFPPSAEKRYHSPAPTPVPPTTEGTTIVASLAI